MGIRVAKAKNRGRLLGRNARLAAEVLSLAAPLLALAGCSGFFVKPTTTTTTNTGTATATTGDYAYVANSSAGTTSLSEYAIGAATATTPASLTSIGTLNLGYVPVALAVSPANSYLYVASAPGASTPGVYLYNINATSGVLTAANSGNVLATDTVAAMTVSPDGNWLFTVNSTGITMNEYQVNTTTGGITLASTITLPSLGCLLGVATPTSQSCSVAVSPSENYVVAALGTSGDAVFTYSSASGITGSGFSTIPSVSAVSGDFSVVLDANNYAYIARTSSVGVYSLGSTITNTSNATYNTATNTGIAPRGIILNRAGTYVFTANEGTGSISSFGIGTGGVLDLVNNGAPFAGPAHVSALGADNTGLYLVAVGYDASTGVRLYSLSSVGVLTQVAAVASGTNTALPALVAMTH